MAHTDYHYITVETANGEERRKVIEKCKGAGWRLFMTYIPVEADIGNKLDELPGELTFRRPKETEG